MKRAAIALVVCAGCTVGGPTSVVGRWRARRVVDSTACVKTQLPGALPPDVGLPPAGKLSTDGAWPPAAAPTSQTWPTPGASSTQAWPTAGAPTESWPTPGAPTTNGTPDGRTSGGGCEQLISIGRDVPARGFTSLAFTFAAPGYIQWRGPHGYVGHGLALNSYFEYLRGSGGLAIGARIGGHLAAGFGDRIAFTTPISLVAHAGGLWGSVYAGAGYSPVALEQQYVGEGDMKTPLPETYHYNSVHGFVGARFWLTRTLERGFSLSPEFRVETFGDSTLTSLTANIGLHL